MCGNVGMAGNLTYSTNKMFKDLLIFDQIRGVHSTGVFAFKLANKGKVLERAVGTPGNLWEKKESEIFDKEGDLKGYYSLLIGHNRHATVGVVNEENCHPFDFENLVGAHNGSLTHYSDLDGGAPMIDSQRLFYTISNKGIEHAWKNFNGAAALVWYDKQEGTVNFIRNKERPLYFVYSKDKKALFWASELWMITQSAFKRNVKLDVDDKGNTIYSQFEENQHYKFEFTSTSVTLISQNKMEVRENTPFRPQYYNRSYQNYNTWEDWEDFYKERTEKKSTPNPEVRGQKARTFFKQGDWAKDTEKADKTTRNLNFVFAGHGEGTYKYLVGTFIDEEDDKVPMPYLEVIPRDNEEYERLKKDLYTDKIFQTTSRCRAAPDKDGRINKLKISAQHVVETPFFYDDSVVDDSNVVILYNSYDKRCLTKDQFVDELSKLEGGACCYACGMDLDVNRHLEFTWLDKTMCVCPDCSSDRVMAAGMN